MPRQQRITFRFQSQTAYALFLGLLSLETTPHGDLCESCCDNAEYGL